ncbi:MAG: photosystem I reaction center subunit XII [Symploca sp. SIO2E9]|nr:photosystem I reaction center subunit XII [Symploca sp. SIO2E9]
MTLWVTETDPLELRPNATEADVQAVIRAVYKQVLGNQHVMDSQRLSSAESMLRNGEISVRRFVGMVAKSSLYQSLFFYPASPYRFIELNFKHLLGRAPQDQAEISEHVSIYNQQGYEAEIDSYLCSDEYLQNFGENIVPYPCSIKTQVGFKNSNFTRGFALMRGAAASDRDNQAKLISTVAGNLSTTVKPPAVGNGAAYGNTGKRYKITVAANTASARLNKLSKLEYVVGYDQIPQQVRHIQRKGGKILSINEVA